MRPYGSCRHLRERHGFSLVEAAIVLGVVGLVICGIWVASSAVTSNQRVNETVNAVLQAADARKNFPLNNFPATVGVATEITSTLTQMGAVPRNFLLDPATHNYGSRYAVGPLGGALEAALYCSAAICPDYLVQVPLSDSVHDFYTKLTAGECTRIVRLVTAALKNSPDLLAVYIHDQSNTRVITLNQPIDASGVFCPSDTAYFGFHFTP